MSTTANSSSEYVVELLSEHGKRRAELGRGSDWDGAYEAYEKACSKYSYNGVRLRQGNQTLAYRLASQFVHKPHSGKH